MSIEKSCKLIKVLFKIVTGEGCWENNPFLWEQKNYHGLSYFGFPQVHLKDRYFLSNIDHHWNNHNIILYF